jgi:hypothetical protein
VLAVVKRAQTCFRELLRFERGFHCLAPLRNTNHPSLLGPPQVAGRTRAAARGNTRFGAKFGQPSPGQQVAVTGTTASSLWCSLLHALHAACACNALALRAFVPCSHICQDFPYPVTLSHCLCAEDPQHHVMARSPLDWVAIGPGSSGPRFPPLDGLRIVVAVVTAIAALLRVASAVRLWQASCRVDTGGVVHACLSCVMCLPESVP